jgi:hypothetical protein
MEVNLAVLRDVRLELQLRRLATLSGLPQLVAYSGFREGVMPGQGPEDAVEG